jgi:predicted ATP-grasp superfamily ATP-dependent carboligase
VEDSAAHRADSRIRHVKGLPEQEQVVADARSRAEFPAVVVDVGFVSGLAAIRSLGRAKAPVLAVDHRRWALGFRSRYAHPVLAPDPCTDEDGFLALLATLGDALGRPAPIFPTHDEGLNAVARGQAKLGERFRYPFPSWETLAGIQNKRRQLESAQAAGIDTPRTGHPRSAEEANALAAELGYPVLVKPADPIGFKRRHRRQGFRCETRAELEDAYARAEPFEPMVQELIPGGDDTLYTLGSYLDATGRPLGIFCGRKLRQTPRFVGTCRVGEAVWVEEVVDAGLRLLAAFEFRGLSQVEFKRDPRDGRYKLMEINPRLWQWHGLAAACGVDLPRLAYCDLLGLPLPSASMNGKSRRWAITFLAGERPAVPRPPYVDAVFARDDLRPVLAYGARVVRGAVR